MKRIAMTVTAVIASLTLAHANETPSSDANTQNITPNNAENTNGLPTPQPISEPIITGVTVEVDETFYRLIRNRSTQELERRAATQARPGDLIELVVRATNNSDDVVRNVELNNTLPNGPITLLRESINTDESKSAYRISRNGQTFFPADAPLNAAEIRFIQWVIVQLNPQETLELSYRFEIHREQNTN